MINLYFFFIFQSLFGPFILQFLALSWQGLNLPFAVYIALTSGISYVSGVFTKK